VLDTSANWGDDKYLFYLTKLLSFLTTDSLAKIYRILSWGKDGWTKVHLEKGDRKVEGSPEFPASLDPIFKVLTASSQKVKH
jgi:hypothetical protein